MPTSAELLGSDVKIVISWKYADATARAAATGFTTPDLYKIALQQSDNSLWLLTAITPTWTAVGGAGTLSDHGHTGTGDGGDLATPNITNYGQLTEVSAPSTPASGKVRIYAKSDHYIYGKDSTGAETQLSGASILSLTAPPAFSSFAWHNQGSATGGDITVGTSPAVYIRAPNAAGDSIKGLDIAVPTAPYTITAGFLFAAFNSNFNQAGLYLRDSGATPKIVTFMWAHNNNPLISVDKYTSATAFSANYANIGAAMMRISLMWFRIEDDNTNRKCSFSADGVNFIQIHSVSRTDFITPTRIGFMANSNNATWSVIATLLSWKQA